MPNIKQKTKAWIHEQNLAPSPHLIGYIGRPKLLPMIKDVSRPNNPAQMQYTKKETVRKKPSIIRRNCQGDHGALVSRLIDINEIHACEGRNPSKTLNIDDHAQAARATRTARPTIYDKVANKISNMT